MNKNFLFSVLAVVLVCAFAFAGCASVPNEKLDEKDAVIQNLNSELNNLNAEVAQLKTQLEELRGAKADLEAKLRDASAALERANKRAAQQGSADIK